MESSNRVEVLLRWCKHVEALGCVVRDLAAEGLRELLTGRGEELGSLIEDLGENIHGALNRVYWDLNAILANETVEDDEHGLSYDEVQVLLEKLINQIGSNPLDSDFAKKVAPYEAEIAIKASVLYKRIKELEDMIEVERRAAYEKASANHERETEAFEDVEQKPDGEESLSEAGDQVKIELDDLSN
jgi:hypothetical protein